jgi:hypothetical protein
MKKFLLSILVFSFSFAVFGQVLLDDFEGNQMSGITISKWATYDPIVLANPLVAGLNASANVMSFPAHDFYAYYMNLGGFLCFGNMAAAVFNDNNYIRFKYLAQDTTAQADTVAIQLKIEKGSEAALYSQILIIPIPAGTVNKWETATMALPKNPDNATITHTQICLIVSSYLKSPVPFYFDDITFLVDGTSSVNPLSSRNKFTAFQEGNILRVKLDKETVINNVEIYSMTGKLVKTTKLGYSTSVMSVPIDMANGCYVLRVNSVDGSMNQKFIKH